MIAFTHETPGYYQLSQIYNSVTNTTNGAIIPREGSLILDSTTGALYHVISVSPVTFDSELEPVGTTLIAPELPTQEPSADQVSIVDFGNSRFYLYYDMSENPTKLNLDKKIIILGDDAKDYEIVKYNAIDDTYVPISMYFDGTGTYLGNRIPLEEVVGTVNAKVPTNCHTSFELVDEEVYYIFIFDYAGTQCGSMKLYAKKAIINNVANDNEIISDFTLEGTQKNALGFYIYQDQDTDSLVISPKLTYNTGREINLPIDYAVTHLYGLEGFTPSYPGQEVEILVKYFLAPLQQAAGNFIDTVGGVRFLYKRERLIVRAQDGSEYKMKILTVPRYNTATNTYMLMFYLYRIGDNAVRDITHLVDIDPLFDGLNTNTQQSLTFSFNVRDVFPAAVIDQIYQQTLLIRLAPYSFYEKYIMQDNVGTSAVYGVDSPILARPIIYYDNTTSQYLIPSTKFQNETQFLEAFYYKNSPLYDTEWLIEPVVPSHFTLRDPATGNVILAAPIAIADYTTAFSILGGIPNMLLDSNVIVEFLNENGGQFDILWGSPVDVTLL